MQISSSEAANARNYFGDEVFIGILSQCIENDRNSTLDELLICPDDDMLKAARLRSRVLLGLGLRELLRTLHTASNEGANEFNSLMRQFNISVGGKARESDDG